MSRERPNGISGLLRVKNGAAYLSACIDSCIDALDELICVYQKSDDATEELLYARQKAYPEKIKIFFYAPHVYSHDLTEDEFRYACTLPPSSVHLLCTYCNFALSKARYRYAVKIDSDQIYFTETLRRCLALYRAATPLTATWSQRLVFWYFTLLRYGVHLFPRRFLPLVPALFPRRLMPLLRAGTAAAISRQKGATSLSGINLVAGSIPWSHRDNRLPFNGVHDTLVFPISSQSYYVPYYDPDQHRIIEHFVCPHRPVGYGFAWAHLKWMDNTPPLPPDALLPLERLFAENIFALDRRRGMLARHMRMLYYYYVHDDPDGLRTALQTIRARLSPATGGD